MPEPEIDLDNVDLESVETFKKLKPKHVEFSKKEAGLEKRRTAAQEAAAKILEEFRINPLMFGMYYFPEHFRLVPGKFHLEITKASVTERYLAVASPRGSAKSTILTFLRTIHGISFKEFRFVVIAQNTFSKAAESLETIKAEIKSNEKFKKDFGIKLVRDSVGDSIFKHRDGLEMRILCKGADQIGSLRGEKFRAYRPDLIIIDDLEDDEMVRNPERRLDLKNMFDEALVPCGEAGKVRILAIGTPLHDDSLVAKLIGSDFYQEYKKIVYKARYEVGEERFSLWPQKWTLEQLDWLEREKPAVFAKEYQCDPTSGMNVTFSSDNFRYWKIEEGNYILLGKTGEVVSRGRLSDCKAAIACDLAWEEDKTADFSVILPAFLTPHSEILVDEYVCKKGLRPHEIEEILFNLEARYQSLTGGSVPIGFEKAKLEKVIKHLLKEAMVKRNKYLIFKDLLWDKDKVTRIETRLEPRYMNHTIYHKTGMGDLEYQLTRFPNGTHDDLPDALQGVVQLLEYPKKIKQEEAREDLFMKLRQRAIDSKKHVKKTYVFGNIKTAKIPCVEAVF